VAIRPVAARCVLCRRIGLAGLRRGIRLAGGLCRRGRGARACRCRGSHRLHGVAVGLLVPGTLAGVLFLRLLRRLCRCARLLFLVRGRLRSLLLALAARLLLRLLPAAPGLLPVLLLVAVGARLALLLAGPARLLLFATIAVAPLAVAALAAGAALLAAAFLTRGAGLPCRPGGRGRGRRSTTDQALEPGHEAAAGGSHRCSRLRGRGRGGLLAR